MRHPLLSLAPVWGTQCGPGGMVAAREQSGIQQLADKRGQLVLLALLKKQQPSLSTAGVYIIIIVAISSQLSF